MSLNHEQKRLKLAADEVLHEHSKLMHEQDHDGAAHCTCELAARYRTAEQAFWDSRARPKKVKETLEFKLSTLTGIARELAEACHFANEHPRAASGRGDREHADWLRMHGLAGAALEKFADWEKTQGGK